VHYWSDEMLDTFRKSWEKVAMDNWVLVALPMFIFMGLMLDRSGIAEGLMKSMQSLFGKVRGGLAVTVTTIGIILAASTGIIGASVVLLGLLCLPAMMNQGYSKQLALGTIASSGTLGIFIPPSIMLVIMADQLGHSVGDLFMGALIPGVILGLLYIAFILVYCLIQPDAAPSDPERRPLEWFVVLIAVSLQTSFLTPPVGFALFYLKGICPDGVELVDIYKGRWLHKQLKGRRRRSI
jgi:tripartite ATP-independent transporter DctM subunit